MPLPGHAEDAAPIARLKAAYLYNYTQFIEWPAAAFNSENDNFSLCILGKNGVFNELQEVTHYKYRQRNFEILLINDVNEAKHCQLVYLSTDSKSVYLRYLEELTTTSVLTVGSATDFIQSGGMIGFIQVGDNLRFEVNRDALLKADLTPRATLLEVAERVIGSGTSSP